MDPRLNIAMIESQEAELRRRAARPRLSREWPDDGRPPRLPDRLSARSRSLHPTAVLASLLTWR